MTEIILSPRNTRRMQADDGGENDPAPEHKGAIAARERRKPEGGLTLDKLADVQTRRDRSERRPDFTSEPTAIDWHHFLHPGKPDEPDELFDEELERR